MNSSPDQAIPADPYEAAQHILKGINFGGLLQLASEEGEKKAAAAAAAAAAANEAAGLGTPATAPIVATPPAEPLREAAVRSDDAQFDLQIREQLRAQLVLLTAQLTEIAREEGAFGGGEHELVPLVTVVDGGGMGNQENEDDSDEDDMEEVSV